MPRVCGTRADVLRFIMQLAWGFGSTVLCSFKSAQVSSDFRRLRKRCMAVPTAELGPDCDSNILVVLTRPMIQLGRITGRGRRRRRPCPD
jgi:hypothetical protein